VVFAKLIRAKNDADHQLEPCRFDHAMLGSHADNERRRALPKDR
jgi:hypothetical protein